MKSKILFLVFALTSGTTVLGLLPACSKAGQMAAHDDDVDYYTCAMHPSVKSHNPKDKCPICSMDLLPVMKRDHEHAGQTAAGMSGMPAKAPNTPAMIADQPSEFTIPLDRQQLIGVTYAQVTRQPLRSVIRAVGTVAVDKQRHWDYVARVDGYVQSLKVFAPGEVVEKGQVLMDIYSPDLMATQNEFLDLLRMRDQAEKNGSTATKENAERLLAAARQRLSQWNIAEAQIEALAESRAALETLQLVSPFRGVVETVGVDQGRRL